MDDDLDHALTAEAARSGRTRSELVRIAVRKSLEHALTESPDPVDDDAPPTRPTSRTVASTNSSDPNRFINRRGG